MARIAGVNIPENKHLEIALTHIYGIGKKTAQDICNKLDIKLNSQIIEISKDNDQFKLSLDDGTSSNSDIVLFATGRVPNIGCFENQLIKTDAAGRIKVTACISK